MTSNIFKSFETQPRATSFLSSKVGILKATTTMKKVKKNKIKKKRNLCQRFVVSQEMNCLSTACSLHCQLGAQPCQSQNLCQTVKLNILFFINNMLLLCYSETVARTCQLSWPESVVIESRLNYTSMKQSPGGKL